MNNNLLLEDIDNKVNVDPIIKKYLLLKSDIFLHILPSQGILFHQRDMSKVIELAHQQFGLQYINEMATKILANCDGTKSISMILVQVETNLNNDQSLKLTPTIGFVKEAIKRGYLECYDHPHPRKIHITGSSDYYTPIHMMLELTYNCNLKCKHCYNDSGLKKADNIPLNDYLKIIQELKNKGVRGVELTGGEPLCHPDFKSIFKECAESFETVAVLTNGYALDEKIAELIGEYKQKVIVQVDLDGSSAEVHDYIRGVHGSFEKAKSAIKYLAQRNIKTRAAMSVLPNSIFDIENTLLLAKELGARWFAFSPVQKIGRGTDMLFNFTDRDYLHMEEIKQTFISKYKDFVLVVSKGQIDQFKKIGNCGAGYRSCVMDPFGNIKPCNLLPLKYMLLGNLKKNTYEEVFNNPTVTYLAKLRAPELDVCGSCSEIYDCNYCIARTIMKLNDKASPCKWAKDNNIEKYFNITYHSNRIC